MFLGLFWCLEDYGCYGMKREILCAHMNSDSSVSAVDSLVDSPRGPCFPDLGQTRSQSPSLALASY